MSQLPMREYIQDLYVTDRSCLKRGILRFPGGVWDISADTLEVATGAVFKGEGREWHRSLGAARGRVEVMKSRRRKKLATQMERLREDVPVAQVTNSDPTEAWMKRMGVSAAPPYLTEMARDGLLLSPEEVEAALLLKAIVDA